MADIADKIKNSFPALSLEPQDGFDRIKAIEKDVFKRVENSAVLAAERKPELALAEAEEAAKALNSLRQAISRDQQQRSSSRPNSSAGGNSAAGRLSVTQNDTRQPMTTVVNLFDLSIMVKCNLATQLRNNGQLESSLELYTQLYKMAIDQIGSGVGGDPGGSFVSEPNGQQQQQQKSRYQLYRFGLDVGNILYEMKDFQRALKYYRLTLDRLSSLSGNKNLQIKLMNNITIVLMTMNGILANDNGPHVGQQKQRAASTFACMSKTNDHVTSLQLLLNDNSYEPTTATTGATTTTTTAAATTATAKQQILSRKSASVSGGDGAGSGHGMRFGSPKQVFNSNQHRFGLNQMVCLHANSDLSSMYSTLGSLVQTDCCGADYKRLFDLSKLQCRSENKEYDRNQLSNKKSLSEINKLSLEELFNLVSDEQPMSRHSPQSAHAPSGHLSSSSSTQDKTNRGSLSGSPDSAPGSQDGSAAALGSTTTTNDDDSKSTMPGLDGDGDAPIHINNLDRLGRRLSVRSSQAEQAPNDGGSAPIQPWPSASSAEQDDQFRQVMSVVRGDELERLICAKEREVHQALITSCNLVIDLDRRARRERRREHRQQQEQHYNFESRPLVSSNHQEHNRNNGSSNSNNKPVADNERNLKTRWRADDGEPVKYQTSKMETSALSRCIKLAAASDLYKSLTRDLLANGVSALLSRKGKLLNALYVLERIGLDQQVGAVDATVTDTTTPSSSASIDFGKSKSHSKVAAAAYQSRQAAAECKSALVATNLGLLYSLRNQINISLELNRRALVLDQFNLASLINMANCQMSLNEFQRADIYYAIASKIEPKFWLTHFNRILLGVKLARHPDDIDNSSLALAHELSSRTLSPGIVVNSFAQLKMALTKLQLSLLYEQSGLIQKSSNILSEMLAGSGARVAPEIFLLTSKLLPTTTSQESSPAAAHAASVKRPLTAISVLQQGLRVHPYHIALAERLIALYISEFDYKNAITVLGDCVRHRPDQVKWYQMLAECHRRSANYKEAIRIYKHAIEVFPMNENCVKSLAKLADELGLSEEKTACQTRLQQLSQARDGFV
jgi:tetratricopeptide (TPR) repeat protein